MFLINGIQISVISAIFLTVPIFLNIYNVVHQKHMLPFPSSVVVSNWSISIRHPSSRFCSLSGSRVSSMVSLRFSWFRSDKAKPGYISWIIHTPLNTWRNDNVVTTPKRRHFDVIVSKWRGFNVITTSLMRNVFAGTLCKWCSYRWKLLLTGISQD